jgi:hypothetical protein
MPQMPEFVSFIANKELVLHIMLKLFYFVKINHNDNKSDTNLKTSQLGKGGEFENLCLHFLLQMISRTASLNAAVEL